MKTTRSRLCTVAVAALLALTAWPAQAAGQPTATWEMNESPGATVMLDSSGSGLNGTIGPAVQTGQQFDATTTGYAWTNTKPNAPPAKPERLVQVPHDNRLNPGTGDFAVEVRLRNTHSFGNVVQKGQSGAPGGYWKFEMPQGRITCLFRGSAGSSSGTSGVNAGLDDGQWHVIRCERTATDVQMWVDGVRTSRNRNRTGNIANTRPITIAGKINCDQAEITCDYFAGDIDYIKIEH